ncbi:MAG: DNA circularization N-terminal domain-containing protein [Beijerinckiaceae bacterium]
MSFKVCIDGADYLPASFQGIPFYIKTAGLTVKPGTARSEFIYRDKPASIDTAKRAEEYSFEGLIIGEDFMARAAAFRAAAAGQQPFQIVHPTFGNLTAGGESIKFADDYISEARCVTVSFDGFEWGELPGQGSGGGMYSAMVGLMAVAASAFTSRYNVAAAPVWVHPQIQQAFEFAHAAVGRAMAASGNPIPASRIAWFDTAAAWDALSSPLLGLEDVSEATKVSMGRLVDELAVTLPVSPAQTVLDAIYHSVRLLSLMALGNASMAAAYLTPGQVLDAREKVRNALNAELRVASNRGDVDTANSIAAYRREFVAEMTKILQSKPPLTSYVFPETVSSMYVAHVVYGDASRFPEVEALNAHLSPLLMQGEIWCLQR